MNVKVKRKNEFVVGYSRKNINAVELLVKLTTKCVRKSFTPRNSSATKQASTWYILIQDLAVDRTHPNTFSERTIFD